MVAAVSSIANNVAAFTRNAADATTLLVQGALAGAQQITQSATLAGRAITQKAEDLWAGSDWIQLDAFGDLLVRHSDGLFIPVKQLAEGPLLPRVKPFVMQDAVETLLDMYSDTLFSDNFACDWNASQWAEFFSTRSVNKGPFLWIPEQTRNAVPFDQLATTFADTQISARDARALSWFLFAPPSDPLALSPAEFIQWQLHVGVPSRPNFEAALQHFPVRLSEQAFLGPDGAIVSMQQLTEGPLYPRVEHYCALDHADHLDVAGLERNFVYSTLSSAERAQIRLVIEVGVRERPSVLPPSLMFLDDQGKLWTLPELKATADPAQFEKIFQALNLLERLDDLADSLEPEIFGSVVKQLGEDYPSLRSWLERLPYSDFVKAESSGIVSANVAQFMSIAVSISGRKLLASIRSLSPADRIRWFYLYLQRAS